MGENIKTDKMTFLEYLYILWKWKNLLILNLLIIAIISTTIAFIIKKEYRATAIVMIAPDNQMNYGGLTSLMGGKSSIAALGAKAFGVSNTSEDVLLGIMNSRTALVKIVQDFDLFSYYEIKDKNMDKVLKAFRGDFSADANEFGMIEVNIVHEDPNIAADIANYLVRLTDSLNTLYNIERARNNRIFLEKRYQQNVDELKKAEEMLYEFQKKYGIVAVPEQLEVSVKAAAEIEAMLTKKEIEAYFIKEQFGQNSPQYQGVAAEVAILKKKVQELKSSTELGSNSNIFFAFKQMPDIAIKYLRVYREVQIQQSILEIVMPMYEQAKVEEQKSIPSVVIIDKAVPPQLKYRPKRMVIIAGILFLSAFILLPFVFISERLVQTQKFINPLQEQLASLANRIKKFYHC